MAKIQFGLKSADAIQQNFKIIFDKLVRGYKSVMGRNPEGLDLIKIRFEAAEKARDSAKVVDRGGMTLDPSKAIMGGTQEGAALKSGIMKATGEGPREITEDTGEGFIDFVRKTDPKAADKLQKAEDDIRAKIEAGNKRYLDKIKKQKEEGTYKRYNPEKGSKLDLEIKEEYKKAVKGESKEFPGKFKGTEEEFRDMLDDITQDFAQGGRIGYKIGSIDKARRAFLKTAAGIGGGIAALKTGLLGLSKKAPEATQKVMENFSSTASEAPNYFFNLVSKIKSFGKQSKVGPSERVNEYSYIGKNGDQYTLTEDIATGDAQIIKDKMGVGSYGDKTFDTINDRTVMEYKAPKQDVDPDTQKFIDERAEYEEYKVEFDSDGTQAGADAIDEIVQKEIIEEATDKAPSIKKAGGGLAYMLGE